MDFTIAGYAAIRSQILYKEFDKDSAPIELKSMGEKAPTENLSPDTINDSMGTTITPPPGTVRSNIVVVVPTQIPPKN